MLCVAPSDDVIIMSSSLLQTSKPRGGHYVELAREMGGERRGRGEGEGRKERHGGGPGWFNEGMEKVREEGRGRERGREGGREGGNT